MKIFTGVITETYSRRVGILADSKEEAEEILAELYSEGDIKPLDYDDYDGEWASNIETESSIENPMDLDIFYDDKDVATVYNDDGDEYDREDLIELLNGEDEDE